MSEVADRAFALVPSEPPFDGLAKKLLALRAEIDALLTELASTAMAMPRTEAAIAGPGLSAALTPPAAEPAAPTPGETPPILSDPRVGDASGRTDWDTIEEAEAASEPGSGQPISDPAALQPIAVELEAPDCVWTASENPPIAAVDSDPAEHADFAGLFPAETSSAADAPFSADTEPAIQPTDAAILDASRLSLSETSTVEEHRQESTTPAEGVAGVLQAAGIPLTPVADAGRAPAMATVISLQARQRKHKGGIATGAAAPMAVRMGRHFAAKIAASILVLLTAASVMVMADRTALGSVPSLPWMSPTPSGRTGIDWLLQYLQSSSEASDLPRDDAARAGSVD